MTARKAAAPAPRTMTATAGGPTPGRSVPFLMSQRIRTMNGSASEIPICARVKTAATSASAPRIHQCAAVADSSTRKAA